MQSSVVESERRWEKKREDGVYIRPRRGSRGVDPLVYSPLSNALHVPFINIITVLFSYLTLLSS